MTKQIDTLRRRNARAQKVQSNKIDVWTHGIASYAEIVAVCVTSYVRTQIAYRTAAEETSTVLFSSRTTDKDVFKFPWQAASVGDVRRAHSRIFEYLERIPYAATYIDKISRRILYSVLMVVLLSLAFKGDNRVKRGHSLVTFLREALRLPGAFAAELSLLERTESVDYPMMNEDVVEFTNRRLLETLEDDLLSMLVDRCPIPKCGQAIGWKSIDEVSCFNRHPLGGRCAITFLPILAPGLSKLCSDCHRQFINELAHPELINAESASDNGLCLAKLLLEWFDTCPYCDGKFFTNS